MSTIATLAFGCFVSLSLGWVSAWLLSLGLAHKARSGAWMATAAFVPAAVAIGSSLALLVPGLGGGCHCVAHGHHAHLCLSHPTLGVTLTAVGAVGLGWLARALSRGFEVVGDAWRAHTWMRSLVARIEVRKGARLVVIDDTTPRALTAGLYRPKTVVTSALWARLDDAERDAIALHEAAHVARRDALVLWTLHLAVAFLPAPLARRLIDSWKLAAELACDRAAAAQLGDGAPLARALLSCARLRVAAPPVTALGVGSGPLEHRVRALLESPSIPTQSSRGDLASALLAGGAIVAAAVLAPGDILHHAVETVFAFVL